MTNAQTVSTTNEPNNTATGTAAFLGWEMNDEYASLFNASQESISCLVKVAANQCVPAAILEQMVHHPAPKVRAALASNASTPVDALRILGGDDQIEVRLALATNKNVPIEVLQLLTSDESAYVSVRAIGTLDRIGRSAGVLSIKRRAFERKLLA